MAERGVRILFVREPFLHMNLNTLEMSRRLKKREFTSSQAEGIVEELMEAVRNSDWATKGFLKGEMAELKLEWIRWMEGLQIAVLGLMIALMSLSSGLLYFLLKN